MINLNENPTAWIRSIIKRYINESPENTLQDTANQRAWAEPLIGFSNGVDPLYQFYKDDIGDFYLLPEELFAHAYPAVTFEPEQLTVISWILPQTAATKMEHRKRTKFPTESWARARIFGEEVNDKLRMHVVKKLHEEGYQALAPLGSPLYHSTSSDKYLFASSWSERHAAYAAGLGTFGLCDGLITPKGKAIRAGSVIAKMAIHPSERAYDNYRAYCLFYMQETCGKCITRCPAGALSESGHDKVKCLSYLNKTREYVRKHYHFEGYGCGLCQTGVPCESRIPRELTPTPQEIAQEDE
ncbi:MAG: epoxyqueuosine reductase [Candidatus Hodarchaeales archaeon]|jgi:epoxyqueuosine reductase QueG